MVVGKTEPKRTIFPEKQGPNAREIKEIKEESRDLNAAEAPRGWTPDSATVAMRPAIFDATTLPLAHAMKEGAIGGGAVLGVSAIGGIQGLAMGSVIAAATFVGISVGHLLTEGDQVTAEEIEPILKQLDPGRALTEPERQRVLTILEGLSAGVIYDPFGKAEPLKFRLTDGAKTALKRESTRLKLQVP